ncbi:DurN family substrate-assisted peptide maturase [Nocardiopsis sediminis]|uniref:DurN family substrate-assisted peptide maturase n=1 Tax=Nocardiopsis sediminis TaxID=1778267 RepID=A0ABV8FKU2_9ACTN
MSVKPPTLYEGVDTIRQIQGLMVLCSLLPPDGRLREVLQLALALNEEHLLHRVEPVPDVHPHTVKAWLESLWFHGSPSPALKEVADWQSDNDNMTAALAELKTVEEQIGMKLVPHKIP